MGGFVPDYSESSGSGLSSHDYPPCPTCGTSFGVTYIGRSYHSLEKERVLIYAFRHQGPGCATTFVLREDLLFQSDSAKEADAIIEELRNRVENFKLS